jgi:hypothetical protein
MKTLLAAAFFFITQAHANPAIHGTWSTAIDGQPLVVTFEPNGTGKVNGKPLQWQALGKLLFVQAQGEPAQSYGFEVKDGKLNVAGGNLAGTVTLTKGTAAADAAKAKLASAKPAAGATAAGAGSAAVSTNGQELVGKWCLASTFTANAGGGSSRMTCFELKPDGTYFYKHEGSMSANAPGMWGGTSSQSQDAGRWKVSGNQLVAQSQRGTTNTYTLEKRNHPKNKRDPMICLNGECYVTFYNKPAW